MSDEVLTEEEIKFLTEKFVLSNTFSQTNNLFDFDFNASSQKDRIENYRKLSQFSEVENAVDEIINEAIVETLDGDIPIELNLNEYSLSYDVLKQYVNYYFDKSVKELHLRTNLYDLFRIFYIDGYLTVGLLRSDKEMGKDGKGLIEGLMFLDPTFLSKEREKYKYKPDINTNENRMFAKREYVFAEEDIIFSISGNVDTKTKIINSNLQKALKPANLLYLMEDSATVYALVRSPSRRIWNVNFGSISNTTVKEERIMKKLASQNRHKISFDAVKGSINNLDKTYMSLTEDIYLPKTYGGPEVSVDVLNGDVSAMQSFEPLIFYFKEKLYEALNVPFTRMKKSPLFTGSDEATVSREEYKFTRFISKLRRKFNNLIIQVMYKYMVNDGIVGNDEEAYEEFKELVFFKYKDNNMYKDRQMNIINDEKLGILMKAMPFVGSVLSQYHVYKNILNMSDEEIQKMKEEMNYEAQEEMIKQQQFMMQQQQMPIENPPEEQ